MSRQLSFSKILVLLFFLMSCTISLLRHFVLLFHSIPQATYIRYFLLVSILALIRTLVIMDLIRVISNTAPDLAIVFIVL